MYAVIETGGKQYRVELGTELAVERLEAEPGSSITLDRVLLVADGTDASIGRPLVADAAVAAEVVAQDRAEKLIVFKYRPKARRRVKKGHRQERTVLRISDIRFNGRSAADDARKAEEDAKTERQRLQEAAARQAAEDAALAAKLADRAAPATPAPAKGRGRAKASAAPDTAAGESPAKPVARRARTPKADASATDTASSQKAPKASDSKPARARTKKDT